MTCAGVKQVYVTTKCRIFTAVFRREIVPNVPSETSQTNSITAMPRPSSNQPRIIKNKKSTTVEYGTFRVTINPLREQGRAPRFRLNWSIGNRRITRNLPTLEESIAQAKAILAERAKGQEPVTLIEERRFEYYKRCEEEMGGVPLDVAVKFYQSQAANSFTPLRVETLVEEHIAAKEARLGKPKASVRWVQTLRSRFRTFAKAFPKNIHEITAEEIAVFLTRVEWNEYTQSNMQDAVGQIYRLGRDRKALPPGVSGPVQPYSNPHKIKTELVKTAKLRRWPRNGLRVSVISYLMMLWPNAAALAEAAGHSEAMLQTIYKQVAGASPGIAQEWFGILPGNLDCDNTPELYQTIPPLQSVA